MWTGSAAVKGEWRGSTTSDTTTTTESPSQTTVTSTGTQTAGPLKVSIGTSIDLDTLRPVKPRSSSARLDLLENIRKLLITKQKDPLIYNLDLNLNVESCYKILNEDNCAHLLTVVEINPEHTGRSFLMNVYTPDLELFLRLSIKPLKPSKSEVSEGGLGDHHKIAAYRRELYYLQNDFFRKVESRQSVDKDANLHVLVQYSNGKILGSLIKGEAGWVIVDAYAYPIYMVPFDPDEKHPTPNRMDTDIIYDFYSSGPDLMTYVGSPLGRIFTQARPPECGSVALDHWLCYGIHFPDHLTASDKALVLTVALSQYCRSEVPRERRQSSYFHCQNMSLGVCCALFVCLTTVLVGGMLAIVIWATNN